MSTRIVLGNPCKNNERRVLKSYFGRFFTRPEASKGGAKSKSLSQQRRKRLPCRRCYGSSSASNFKVTTTRFPDTTVPSQKKKFSSLPSKTSSSSSSPLIQGYDRIPSEIAELVRHYANQEATPISIQQLLFGIGDDDKNNDDDHDDDDDGDDHNDDRTEKTRQSKKAAAAAAAANSWRQQRRSSPSDRLGQRLIHQRILIRYAQLLQRELPIRLAHRIQDLDRIPHLRDMPSVQMVKGNYIHSLLNILTMGGGSNDDSSDDRNREQSGGLTTTTTTIPTIETPEQEAAFGDMLTELYQQHSDVLVQMAQGAMEFRRAVQEGKIPHSQVDQQRNDVPIRITFAQQEECHGCLNRFYHSRVGIRVLAGQYLRLRNQLLLENDRYSHPYNPPSKNFVGMICKNTSPYEIVQNAVDDATRLCQYQFPGKTCPEVIIEGRLDLTFCYVPAHLHYIVLELLKNAMRATMEFHYSKYDITQREDESSSAYHYRIMRMIPSPPPVSVIIADGMENEDVVIKVADEGGGIPRSEMEHVWSYLYTTADPSIQQDMFEQDQRIPTISSPILAGLGYGLPISRAYARYFGGDLDIMSMEGYGTDAFCYLVRLGDRSI